MSATPAGRWPIVNPVRLWLDLFGAGLALAALQGLYGWSARAPLPAAPLAILPITHFALFMVSAAYHGFDWSPPLKARWQRVDHSMIYVKVAGGITALALLADAGGRSAVVIAAVWAIAALGIVQKVWFPNVRPLASSYVQLVQACLCLLLLQDFASRFPGIPFQLLMAGMGFYLVGFGVFMLKTPRLWPGRFCHHDLFHVLLICGSLSLYGLMASCLDAA